MGMPLNGLTSFRYCDNPNTNNSIGIPISTQFPNYQAYFSYELHLHLFDPIVSDMVSEQYRCAYSDPEDDEEVFVGDEEDLEASASETSCSSAVSIVFGSFGNSVSPPPSPWIASAIDEFTFKVGDIPCFLDDSSCSNHTSAFNASEEIKKAYILDSKLIVSAKSTNSNSEFTVSEVAIKNSKSLVTDFVLSGSGPVYGVSFFFVGKQEQVVIAVKNQFQCFDLHDEHIVDFDPGGNLCGLLLSFLSSSFSISFFMCTSFDIDRLWWIPWDRGKKRLLLFDSHTDTPLQKLSRGKVYRFEISVQCITRLHRGSAREYDFNSVHRSLIRSSKFGMKVKDNS